MVDKFTKWIETKPVKMAESSPVIDFISGVVHRYGVPQSIITDNDSNFIANEVKASCANLGSSSIMPPYTTHKPTVKSNTPTVLL